MRIVSGKARGHSLYMVKSTATRPTADRIKEALFNILGQDLTGYQVLDLFAGIGSIGLEALSRGAASVTFVDVQQACTDIIKRNIAHTKLDNGRVSIINSDYQQVLKNTLEKFDLIYLDPPYASNYAAVALELIRGYNLLKENGIAVVEHDKNLITDSWQPYRQKKYGQIYLSFFRIEEGE